MLFISVFVICLLIGVPIAFSMGLAGLIYLPFNHVPVIAIVQRIFGGLDSFTLLAVPLYLLVGEIMEKGGISMRIINFADSLVGHIRGGLGHVVVVTTYIMSGISGSTTADTAAVGSVMIPSMERKGYKRIAATAIVAAAGGMDILIPPCITMIILGTVCGLSIGNLFFAGIFPAAVMAAALMIVIYTKAKQDDIPLQPRKTLRHVGRTFNDAFLALLIPIIILGGIKIGIFTATEGAVAAAIYAAIVAVFCYREVKLKDWKGILLRAATATAQIELLIAMASLLAWVTARERLPDMLLQFILSVSDSPYIFLLFVNVIFLLFGAVLEGSPAIIILAPLFMPVATKLGLDPIYFGTVLMANLGVGFILPPVGLALLVATSVGKITIAQLSKPIMPYFLAMVIAMLLITYIPDVSLALPKLFGYKPIGSFVSISF